MGRYSGSDDAANPLVHDLVRTGHLKNELTVKDAQRTASAAAMLATGWI